MPSVDLNAPRGLRTQALRHTQSADVRRTPKPSVTSRASVLDGQDDLSGMLASMWRRNMSRRVDKPNRARTGERLEATSHTHKDAIATIRMLLQGGGTGSGSARQHAQTLFPAPEELALVLAGLREDAELDAKVHAHIDKLLADLIREYGHARICAGINTARVVSQFSTQLGISAEALRRAYSTLISANAGEIVTYRYLIDQFGFARRGMALDFLEQALAADMAADTPTHPPESFQPLRAMLFQLRLIRSADWLLLSGAGGRRWRERQTPIGDDTSDVFDSALVDLLLACLSDIQEGCKRFAHCLARWRDFANDAGVSNWAGRMLRAMAEVPTELFPDMAYRQSLLISLSEVVDGLFSSTRGANARLRGTHV